MKGDLIPEQHHISRYCSATKCTENGEITGAAFLLRPTDRLLSVNWLQSFHLASRQEEINEVRRILNLKLRLGVKAKIAVLNVGEVLNYVHIQSPDSRNLIVLHDPEENDPSHTGIYGYRYEDHLIADLIAEVVQTTYPAREPN